MYDKDIQEEGRKLISAVNDEWKPGHIPVYDFLAHQLMGLWQADRDEINRKLRNTLALLEESEKTISEIIVNDKESDNESHGKSEPDLPGAARFIIDLNSRFISR